MKRVLLGREKPRTVSLRAGNVVRLDDHPRFTRRPPWLLKRHRPWVWALIGVTLFATMVLGAFSDSAILKGLAWVSFGILFLLIAPFTWWLNDRSRR